VYSTQNPDVIIVEAGLSRSPVQHVIVAGSESLESGVKVALLERKRETQPSRAREFWEASP
jgi:hypothetical protein